MNDFAQKRSNIPAFASAIHSSLTAAAHQRSGFRSMDRDARSYPVIRLAATDDWCQLCYAAVAFASAAALGGDLANNFEINIVSW